jgi:hypothetical protein
MARGVCMLDRRGNRNTWLVAHELLPYSFLIRGSSQVGLNKAIDMFPSDITDCRWKYESGETVSQHMAHVCPKGVQI